MSRRRGFSLIELLIVLVIVALLIGILLPVLGRSRSTAKAVVCLSNVRQLVTANLAYAADHREFLVRAAPTIFDFPDTDRWHGKRDSPLNAFDPRRGDLSPYFGESGAIKACPAFVAGEDYIDDPLLAFEAGCGGYGYNKGYLGGRVDLFGEADAQSAQHSARVSDITEPAETVMFADAAYHSFGGQLIAYSFVEPVFWLNPAPWQPNPDPTIHFRHDRHASVGWADGHADSRKIAFTRDYASGGFAAEGELWQLGIGYFGPQSNRYFDLN
ncbi:MAG: type II secretion system protein [Planctomycetota bacterium]